MFQKIYDEIKYLCKIATAGSKEAKEFEKLKKTFAEAYRQKNNTVTDDGVKYSITNKADDSKAVVRIIIDNISKISNESHFSVESEKLPDGIKPSDYIFNIFAEQGGKAINDKLGIIDLSRSGAKSTALHGFGNNKLAAVKAIQNVIEKGKIINKTENYNGTDVDRYTIAAKGTIDGKSAIVGVVVKAYPKNKSSNAKFYLHEAIIKETDSRFMTAPQLSVDTVSESVSNNRISQDESTVNNDFMQKDTKYSLSGIDEAISFVENEIRGEDIKLQQSENSIIDDVPIKNTTSAETKNDNTIEVPDITVGDEKHNELLRKISDISFEEFTNSNSSIWKNIDYNDEKTKTNIMREVHQNMVDDGAVVEIADDVKETVAESYPDLRSMKKKDRTPILKEAINKLKSNLRNFLSDFKNQSFEFEVSGKVLEAKLYNTGINEVLEKITQDKAEMLYSTKEIFRNARYLYSTPDYDGDPNVYRWNYFYTPVKIGNNTVGVRIAVRDTATPQESQIYNWGIKKDTSLDGVGRGDNDRISNDVSSDVSTDIIPNDEQNVNTDERSNYEVTPKLTRKEYHSNIIDSFKSVFAKNNLNFDDILNTGKRHSALFNNDNTPQRVLEKTFGTKAGKLLADLTVNRIAQNETEAIKWVNSITGKGGLLENLSKEYNIKPGSKESAAAQMYLEGFYVNESDEYVRYGDVELAADFPDRNVRENIRLFAKDPRVIFNVGVTSKVLQKLGVKKQKITWDSKKIIKIKSEHIEMSDEVIKQVPYIIDNPIVVMQSQTVNGRLTMFGEVYIDDKPILAVLELNPSGRNGIALDEIKIASAYSKDNAQRFINNSKILFVDENKKRVRNWEMRTRLQLPVGTFTSNSNNSISNSAENVKEVFGYKINQDAEVNEDLLEDMSYYHPDAEVDTQGNITVYHRTTKANAEKIKQTGVMTAKEDAIFFSSKENANKIYELTGIDVANYMIAIEARQIEHILKDHGINSKSDKSMADDLDIARMQYTISNPDEISNSGRTQAYTYMKNGRNRTAPTVLLEKT